MHPHKRSLTITGLEIKTLLERLPTLAAGLLRETLLLVYPPMCAGCSRAFYSDKSEPFCRDCFIALDLISEPYCTLCGITSVVIVSGPFTALTELEQLDSIRDLLERSSIASSMGGRRFW